MNINKKSLLVACVLAAMSTTTFAASSTTSTSSTTVTNHDTPTSTSTRVTREQHTTTTSSTTISTTEKSSTKSSSTSVSVGAGRLSDQVVVPIINPQQQPPKAIKALQTVVENDGYIKLGQLAMVKQNGKWGLVGTDGKVLLEPQFKEMSPSISADGTFFVRRPKVMEQIKGDGTAVVATSEEAYANYTTDLKLRETIADAALNGNGEKNNTTYASDSYTSFSVKGKWGFNDASGKTVIEPQFKEIYTKFSEDRAFVKNAKGKTVAIDGSGNTIFEAPTNDLNEYKNGLAEYRRHISKFNFGGLLGLAVGIGLSNHGGFYYGDAWNPVYDGVKRGYLDRNGNIIIDSKNDAVWPMTEYGTLVKNQGKLGFMNRQGQYVIQPGNYDAGVMDTSSSLLVLKNKDNEKLGIFNVVTGKQVVPFVYDSISFVSPTRMSVVKGESTQLIDMTSGQVLFTTLKDMSINVFGGPYAWVHKGSAEYQLIDENGKVLFRDKDKAISDVGMFRHGYAPVKSKGKWGVMNPNGEWIVKPIYDAVEIL
ncbi:WG repeat-containing protein [uncultured Veillonella sp.]|uniref:WG repeat-containing protein n=1 Tax=uncultured Veillonella sp. TaxID=159268 RepID=UPI00262A5C08|nr:WG repeat-containing protein [uncultured Veillonella sp.]